MQPTVREPEDAPGSGPVAEMSADPKGGAGTEGDLRRIRKEVDKRDFQSEEELNAFLQGLVGRRLDDVLGPDDDPTAQAHELAQRAMRTGSAHEALELAQRALELDSACIDAMSVLAQLGSRSRDELIESLREVVQHGRDALGEEYFEEHRGHFWGMVETRPFMRAKLSLAEQLAAEGREEEAMVEYEEILELNRNDNQGVRYSLLGLFLANDRLDDARRLMDTYEEKVSAVMAWGAVLERLLGGDETGAAAALEHARARNPHAESYFTGARPLPESSPESYTMGSRNEAQYCALELGPAWERHRDAVEWLRAQVT